MKNIFTIFLTSLLLTSFGFGNAQNSTLVATVNIEEPFITTTKDNSYSVLFKITNREGFQSDIRYGLELVGVQDLSVVDRELQNQSLTLGENEAREIRLNYTIPSYVKTGDYNLAIIVKNSYGLPLAYFPLEKTIQVTNSKILPEIISCDLLEKKISTQERPDISCKFSENKNINNYQLGFSVHKNDIFGDMVQENSFNLENKNFATFSLNSEIAPGMYVIDIFLKDKSGYQISPSYSLPYFIEGNALNVNNIILDKTSYLKDEVANLEIFWLSSQEGKMMTLFGEIKNKFNETCGKIETPLNTQALGLSKQSLKINIVKDCEEFTALIKVIDEEGFLLYETSIKPSQPVQEIYINPNIPKKSLGENWFGTTRNFVAIIAIILIIFITWLALKMYKKHKK